MTEGEARLVWEATDRITKTVESMKDLARIGVPLKRDKLLNAYNAVQKDLTMIYVVTDLGQGIKFG